MIEGRDSMTQGRGRDAAGRRSEDDGGRDLGLHIHVLPAASGLTIMMMPRKSTQIRFAPQVKFLLPSPVARNVKIDRANPRMMMTPVLARVIIRSDSEPKSGA